MPEHLKSMSYAEYVITVQHPRWLRGEEANSLGLMWSSPTDKLDIFGWILTESGYSQNEFSGMRIPSQFAQSKLRSNRKLEGVASFLTTPTHVDTDFAVSLGKINDDPSIDIFECEKQIAAILKTKSIGVNFIDALPTLRSWDSSFEDAKRLFKELVENYTSFNARQIQKAFTGFELTSYRLYYMSPKSNSTQKYVVALTKRIEGVLEVLGVGNIPYATLIAISNAGMPLGAEFNAVITPMIKADRSLASAEIQQLLGLNQLSLNTEGLMVVDSIDTAAPVYTPEEYSEDDYPEPEEDCDCEECRIDRGEYVEDDGN